MRSLKIPSGDRALDHGAARQGPAQRRARRPRLPDRRRARLRRQRRLRPRRPREPKFFEPKYDAAGDGARQPGSAFKPILYAAAFDAKRLTPGSLLLDVTTEFDRAPGLGAARRRPARARSGPRAASALQYSLNIPAIRALERVGNETGRQDRRGLGLRFTGGRKAFLQAGLAGALGTVEVRPLDLTSAYGDDRQRRRPRAAADDPRDPRDPTAGSSGRRPSPTGNGPISPQAAFLVTDILAGNTDPASEPDLGREAGAAQRAGRRAPAGGGQDRHDQRRPRPGDLRLPAADRQGRRRPRRRRLDGQQRPLQPALEATPATR